MKKENELEPKSKRIGGLPGLPLEGEDARSAGPANENATITGAERTSEGNSIPERDGPDVGENGEFRPAQYPITLNVELKNGENREIRMIRQDR